MSWTVPTTKELADSFIAKLESKLSQTIPLLPKAFERVLSTTLAGQRTLLYKYAGFLGLQMFVSHATDRETTINGKTVRPLVELGRLIGVGDPDAATRAELIVDVTVTDQTGETVEAGTQLIRKETGVIYLTLEPFDRDAATKQVTIRASSDQDGNGGRGTIGNLEAGDTVSFLKPLSDVEREATVSSQQKTAADAEGTEVYRGRVRRRRQSPPQGGAYADYQAWAEGVTGIIHAYPYTSDTPGEIDVYCEATEASSGSADGIPTQQQLDDVAAAIDKDESGVPTRRPANAAVNVFAIARKSFDIVVADLTVDDEATIKTSIENGVDEYLRDREPYIEGLSYLPRNRVTQAEIAGIIAGIVHAASGTFSGVELHETGGGVVTGGYTLQDGEKAKLNAAQYS